MTYVNKEKKTYIIKMDLSTQRFIKTNRNYFPMRDWVTSNILMSNASKVRLSQKLKVLSFQWILSPKIIFFGRKKKKIFPFSFVEGKTLLGERGIGLRQHNIEKKEERESWTNTNWKQTLFQFLVFSAQPIQKFNGRYKQINTIWK